MAKKIRTRAGSLVTTQRVVAGEHLNSNGTLFGGYLMCWMDEIAFLCARRFTGKTTCVTVNIDNITFRTPIKLNEHVHLSAWVNRVGQTSMEIEVVVERENPKTQERTHTNNAHLTFVCLNRQLRPIGVPRLALESIEDQRKNRESQIRARVRKRLGRFLQRRLAEDWVPSPKRALVAPKRMGRFRIEELAPRGLDAWLRRRIAGLPLRMAEGEK